MTNREMKSKVMSLGNKLAVRMDRHEAFIRAWVIVKAGGIELAVKGVTFGVQNGRGLYCMGYLPAEYAPAAAGFRASGLHVLDGEIRGARIALAV